MFILLKYVIIITIIIIESLFGKKHMMDKKAIKILNFLLNFLKQGIEMLQRVISTDEFLKIEFDVKWLLLDDCILPRCW